MRADLVEVYKIIHGLSAIAFESFFEFNKSGHTRGHSEVKEAKMSFGPKATFDSQKE